MKKLLTVILSIVLIIVSLGAVTTSADSVMFGDVNEDAAINNRDLALMMQYINKWNVTINFVNSDVIVDGKLNNRDYSLLMQHINKWDVTLGVEDDGLINDGVNPDLYRGTTINFATTITSQHDESGPVISAFEKEYGIRVNEILVVDNVNEVASMIASGLYIDVVRCNDEFPAILSILQPLDEAKLDLTEQIWDKNFIDLTTINGKPYLCNTIGNIWAENACVIYSKSLLKRAGCNTPEEYDAQGKWTWDAFAEIAEHVEKIDAVGSGIRGCYYYLDDMLGSIGCGLYKYENGTFSNGTGDSLLREAISRLAEWNKDGFVCRWYDAPFEWGETGICTGNAWSLKQNGSNANYANLDDIGFYYMPAYNDGDTPNATGIVRGWGIARGAKNPVAAGIFLREYLDVYNYDTYSAFINDEACEFFFRMTDIDYNKYTPHFTSPFFSEFEWEDVAFGNPNFVAHSLSGISGDVDEACNILNDLIEKNT